MSNRFCWRVGGLVHQAAGQLCIECGDPDGHGETPITVVVDPRDVMIARLRAALPFGAPNQPDPRDATIALVIAESAIVDIVGVKWDVPENRECVIANTALTAVRAAIMSVTS
jgi:hypothetical protein